MQRHFNGYAKTSYVVCKTEKIVINAEDPGSDLGLATGDPDVRISLSPLF
jgi:hypothetical protein